MPATLLAELPEAEYHAHPALSASGAKRLIQTCPAIFKHERDHGRPEKRAFDFGHAVHGIVLGFGEPVHVIDADGYTTKAARELRNAAYAIGAVPILSREWDQAQAAAAAVMAHPLASALLSKGEAELSIFWDDERWGIERRARLDWFTALKSGRPCAVDLKTAASADPKSFGRKAYDFGYDIQAAFYRDALEAVGYEDPAFLFIVVEKEAPHVVTVVELDDEAKRIGRARTDRALEMFRDCTESGLWPGYSQDIELVSLPRYAAYDLEAAQ